MLAVNDKNENRARYYAADIEWAVLRHLHGGENGIEMPSSMATAQLYRKRQEPKAPTAREIITDLQKQLEG